MRRGTIKKSVAIVGEGETEWFYFESLRLFKRYPFKLKPVFPGKGRTDIKNLIKKAQSYLEKDSDLVFCLIDMDRIKQNAKERQAYEKLKNERSNRKIRFIETYPCTEFWFLLHFLPELSKRDYPSYDALLPTLRKYLPGYEKTTKYFKKKDLYCYLMNHGSLDRAMENSRKLAEWSKAHPEDHIAYSEIHELLAEIEAIMEENNV